MNWVFRFTHLSISDLAHFYTLFGEKSMCALRGPAETGVPAFASLSLRTRGLRPLRRLRGYPHFPTGGFRELSAILPLLVKSNIVFPTRPFAGFSGKRSFFISRLKFSGGGALGEDLDKLRQEYEDATVKAAQYKNQVTRLQNRLSYKENRTRKERAHRLITKGAAIESIVPATKDLSEVDFYSLMEKVFALPEVTGVIERNLEGGDE